MFLKIIIIASAGFISFFYAAQLQDKQYYQECIYENIYAYCGQIQLDVSTAYYTQAIVEIEQYLTENNGKIISTIPDMGYVIVLFEEQSLMKMQEYIVELEEFITIYRAHYDIISAPSIQ